MIPDDLIPLKDVLAQFKPRRKWWQARIDRGEIIAYRIPGERGIRLSRADVERMTQVHPLEIRPKPKEEPTSE